MSVTNQPKDFCDVDRDDGDKIRSLVIVLSEFAGNRLDEWDPIMVMLEEINARLSRLLSQACEEGDKRPEDDKPRQQEAA